MVAKPAPDAITRPLNDRLRYTPRHQMEDEILLIGGSVRAAAVDAAASGYRVVAMDHFGDADLRAVCQRWIHLPTTEQWPHLVPHRPLSADAPAHSAAAPAPPWTIVPTGGFDWPANAAPTPLTDPPAWVAFPTKSQFDAMRDPMVLADLAATAGYQFPITCLANAAHAHAHAHAHAQHQLAASPPHRWLIKPLASTGGLGIRALDTNPLVAWQHLQGDQCLQERVPGIPIGANFLSRFHHGTYQVELLGLFAGLTYRKNHNHRWLYGGSFGPLLPSARPQPPTGKHQADSPPHSRQLPWKRLGETIAKRFDLVGLFNVDLILTPAGTATLLEINPRYSASMELLPGAGRLIDCHLAAYQERQTLINTEQASQRFGQLAFGQLAFDHLACKRIVYARRPTRFAVPPTDLQNSIDKQTERSDITITCHDLPANDDLIPTGYPILTLIARTQAAPSPSTLPNLLRQTHRIAAHIRRILDQRSDQKEAST